MSIAPSRPDGRQRPDDSLSAFAFSGLISDDMRMGNGGPSVAAGCSVLVGRWLPEWSVVAWRVYNKWHVSLHTVYVLHGTLFLGHALSKQTHIGSIAVPRTLQRNMGPD